MTPGPGAAGAGAGAVPPEMDRRFAEVAVAPPLRRSRPGPVRDVPPHVATFHYRVPRALAAAAPGHLVRVPFGRGQRPGVLVALAEGSPVERTRPLAAIESDVPLVSVEGIALARWMSAYYLAPLFECLAAMLPPGSVIRRLEVYRRTRAPIYLVDHDIDALKVLGMFAGGKALTGAEVARRSRVGRPGAILDALVASGHLRRDTQEVGRGVSHRRRSEVRLLAPAAGADDALRGLRASPRGDIVALLAAAPEGREARELLAAVGCGRGVLLRLAKAGHVTLERRGPPGASSGGGRGQEVVRLTASGDPWSLEVTLRGLEAHTRVLEALSSAGGVMAEAQARRSLGVPRRVIDDLVAAGLVERTTTRQWRDPLAGGGPVRLGRLALTSDQDRAWRIILPALETAWQHPPAAREPRPDAEDPLPATAGGTDDPPVVLLHGVTGSGKTELYLRAVAAALEAGRSALVLVPEIALAPQTVARVAGRFGEVVGVWHSQLSAGERLDTWERARRGEVRVLVGSRSAVFAPLVRLGVVVIDEEHADAYKQGATPRYHARDTALVRARYTGAAVILGSATPSIETAWHAERGRYRLAVLPRRVAAGPESFGPDPRSGSAPSRGSGGSGDGDSAGEGEPAGGGDSTGEGDSGGGGDPSGRGASYRPLPEVTLVDMRRELVHGNTSPFSRDLATALEATLDAGRQAILFLNRRGSATFILCRGCGSVAECPRCGVSLTYHDRRGLVVCHHCGRSETPPMMCRHCGSHMVHYYGLGTQRVEAEVRRRFPEARVLRWDADTTRKRGSHEAILTAFTAGDADVLVGTQMVAKGLDLPEITLVGVVSADTSLALPDFRSAERTFQLLAQVAGRAGRSGHGGRVILQTFKPADPAILAAANHDFAAFARRELAFRGEHFYPPYSHLVRLEHRAAGEAAARRAAEEMARALEERIEALGVADTEIIGPAPCFFPRLRGRHRWQLVLRSPSPHAVLGRFVLGPGWRVDVDPVSLL